ncbi:MAG: tetratricopeptide repeat protein [Thermoguttaceae bacterium]
MDTTELQKLAEDGDAHAQYELARQYLTEPILQRDDAEIYRLMKSAFDLGNIAAINGLGILFLNGIGVEQNEQKAVNLFQRAVDSGVAKGYFNLGYCLVFGLGIKKDVARGVELMIAGAEKGYSDGFTIIGKMYFYGVGVRKNLKKAVEFFRRAEITQNLEGLYYLAYSLLFGLGTKKDVASAVAILQHPDVSAMPGAEYLLGWCHQHGCGVEKNFEEMERLYRSAAATGYGPAEYELGCLLESGKCCVAPIYDEAEQWLNLAAEHDYPWGTEAEKNWRHCQIPIFIVGGWVLPIMAYIAIRALFFNAATPNYVEECLSGFVFGVFPTVCWIGAICGNLRMSRWATVWVPVGLFYFLTSMSITKIPPPWWDVVAYVVSLILILSGLIIFGVFTAKRTYWLERKINRRRISFVPTFVLAVLTTALFLTWRYMI